MAQSYHAHGAASTHTYTFSQKWGDDPFTALGHAQVPAALFVYGARLGVKPEEGYLICCILHFKRSPSDAGPSQEKLAELFGKSPETVRRLLRRLEARGLLAVTRARGDLGYFTHTVYDWRPLRARLNECYCQDHPQERPAPQERPTPQKQGVPAATPQKPPGHPTDPRGGIHRSVGNVPRICGPLILREEERKESEDAGDSPSAVSSPPPPVLGGPEKPKDKAKEKPSEKPSERTGGAGDAPHTGYARFRLTPQAAEFDRWRREKFWGGKGTSKDKSKDKGAGRMLKAQEGQMPGAQEGRLPKAQEGRMPGAQEGLARMGEFLPGLGSGATPVPAQPS